MRAAQASPLLLAQCLLVATALRVQQPLIADHQSVGVLRAGPELPTAPTGAGAGGAGDSGDGQPGLGFQHMEMSELVLGAGYPLEEHFVETADGYVLGVYRIPHGRTAGQHAKAAPASAAAAPAGKQQRGSVGAGAPACQPPVLLQHGLLDSSAAWVLNAPDQSLGFILADAGYDVWMGNSRGNAFSRNHTGLDPAQAAFWDFSWDEMATYDLPAVVDHVLNVLSEESCTHRQLAYIGHSQGTTQMFAALASSAELRAKLSLAAMLAPAVHMRYIGALPFQVLAAMDADKLFTLLGAHEFLPSRMALAKLFWQVCHDTPLLCTSVITAVCGFNSDNMNLTRLPTMVEYAPSGCSVKNIAQWAQAIRKSRERRASLFQMYDYEDVCWTPRGMPHTCNMRVYHQTEPPSYNLSAIDTPLAIFYGGRDRLADQADVKSLLRTLPQGSLVYTHAEPTYEHLDFTWGVDARERIYPAIQRLLQRHQPH